MAPMKFFSALLALPVALACLSHAQTVKTSLDGEWRFALDPVDAGVTQEWFKPGLVDDKWDKVSVPHCYSTDRRYHYHTGPAWYFKKFPAPAPDADGRVFIRFDAVYYHATVWLNGKELGEHEGGYTPFEFDVTGLVSADNHLAVRVDNSWSTATLPGAKTKVGYQRLHYGQLFPWMNYGGITRPVSLVARPALHIDKVRIETHPDLAAGTARLDVRIFVKNASSHPWTGEGFGLTLHRDGRKIPARVQPAGPVRAEPQASAEHRVRIDLAREDVALWGFDSPTLYEAEITAGRDVARVTFGIRVVEVRGTQLLLNGEPLSLGGCNRPLDSPGNGSTDPAHILEKDLRMIKSGGMELSRISHYPVSTELLDWADRHGLLIISEAGNWQLTPAQMADPVIRAKYQAQAREMIERDWNHPSVIAYSLGNEYQSQTKEGMDWTRDMYAFTKSLDPTRLVTFASNVLAKGGIKKPEDEASRYVDFISANIYGGHLAALRRIHALYPDKPVYISEFGRRVDEGGENAQVAYVRKAAAEFRQCADFLVGASVWTFNDYESSFPGTNADGYRPWGMVAPDRTPRAMYRAFQTEFAPATVTTRPAGSGQIEIVVAARADFPRYTLRGYTLKAGGRAFDLPVLAPGQTASFKIDPPTTDRTLRLEKPGGFVILETTY